jgi:hypothetical protein
MHKAAAGQACLFALCKLLHRAQSGCIQSFTSAKDITLVEKHLDGT